MTSQFTSYPFLGMLSKRQTYKHLKTGGDYKVAEICIYTPHPNEPLGDGMTVHDIAPNLNLIVQCDKLIKRGDKVVIYYDVDGINNLRFVRPMGEFMDGRFVEFLSRKDVLNINKLSPRPEYCYQIDNDCEYWFDVLDEAIDILSKSDLEEFARDGFTIYRADKKEKSHNILLEDQFSSTQEMLETSARLIGNEYGDITDAYLLDVINDQSKLKDLQRTIVRWLDENAEQPEFWIAENSQEFNIPPITSAPTLENLTQAALSVMDGE